MPMTQRVVLITLAVGTVGLLVVGMLMRSDPILITCTAAGLSYTYLFLRWRGQTPAGAREIAARTEGRTATH